MALIVLGLGWIAGLVAVAAFGAPWWMGGAWVAAAAPITALTGWFVARRWLWPAAAVAAFVSGWWLNAAAPEAPESIAGLGGDATVIGTVVSEPNSGETTTGYVIAVEALTVDGRRFEGGRLLAFMHQSADYLPGDRLTLRGEIEEPPRFEGFDYRAYLARQGISATMYRPSVLAYERGDGSLPRWLTDGRLRLDRALQRALPAPEAALAGGIAFGRDDELSDESKAEFNRSGLRHLVAVSGSNVSLVAALTYALAIPAFGRRWAWLPAAVTILAYLGAAGLSASVFRAGIMAGVLLGGTAIGRPQSGLPALFAAVVAMTALEPRLAYEPGFQLSATATAALIAFAPRLRQWLMMATSRIPWVTPPAWLCESVALSTAASLATAPIMWVTFEQISLVSPVANAVVQPMFVVAFWLSVATALLDLVAEPLAEVAALAAYYPLAYIEWVAGTFGTPRWAALGTSGGGAGLAVAAFAMLGGLALASYRFGPSVREENNRTRKARARSSRLVVFVGVGAFALAVIPVSLLPRGGPGELEVAFLDVGQGDAILLTTPHGHQVLVDGGPSGIRAAAELSAVMPHWDRTLDAVILTHPQEDHVAGLVEVLRRFDVGQVYTNGIGNETISYDHFHETTGNEVVLARGDTLEFDGVHLEVLWPEAGFELGDDLNNSSLVIRVTYGETTFLLTGDSEGVVHETLHAAGDQHADVLKVPHHGSKTTPAWFLEAVRPAVAVISAGAGNVYGHPHEDTLRALEGTRLYRTDLDGRVTVRSNGERLTVSTSR